MISENYKKLILLPMLMILLACGGGGSGSSDAPSPSSFNYTGITTQAVLSEDNAMDLAMGSYSAGAFGSFASGGASSQSAAPKPDFSHPCRQRLLLSAKSSILGFRLDLNPKTNTRRSFATSSNTVRGNCGGSLTVEIDLEESSGDFTGTFNYDAFCEDSVSIDGNGRLSGRANSSGAIQQFRMTFSSLAINEPELAYEISGWIDIRLDGDGAETNHFDLLMRDNATNKIYWANDYTVVTAGWGAGTQSTMSGRYYDPDHGYVEIRTEIPLRRLNDDAPTQGTLMVAGQNDAWIRMSFHEDGTCRLEADFNRDDTIDWTGSAFIIIQPGVNLYPVANAGADRTVQIGTMVVMDGGLSFDPDDDPISYRWSFVTCPFETNCPVLNDPYTPTPSFTAASQGRYELQLVVNDGLADSSPDFVVITATSGTDSESGLLNLNWKYGIFGTNIGKSGLKALDLDDDGSLEILASASLGGFADNRFWYVLRQNAMGQYDQVWSSNPYDAIIRRILAADIDGNNAYEIYVALENGTIAIYNGSDYSEIGHFSTGSSLATIAIHDTDGDGDLEIISSNGANLQIFSGQSHELLWSSTTWGGTSLTVGNVDNDPSPEIVSTNANGHGYVVNGVDHLLDWDYLSGFGNLVEVGDIDGDGIQEIVGAEAWDLITIFDAEIKTPSREIATDLDIAALLVADCNGDQIPEILYGDGQWGQIHCHDGRSLVELWSLDNPEHGVGNIALGDVDRDGSVEVLWGAGGSSTGEDHLYVAGISSQSIEWQSLHLDGPLSAVDVGDVDDDGQDEIVMVSFESNSNYADGIIHIFDARTHLLEWRSTDLPNITAWSGVNSVKIGDVDGDGVTEFVIATADTYDALIQIYDGPTHTLERASIEYTGTSFTKLALGDVDSDGQLEIVVGQRVQTTGASGMHVVVFNGATAQQEWQSTNLSSSWGEITDIILSDIDDDGHIEIISSVSDGLVYAFDGITHQMDWLEEIQSNALAAHDLNADGRWEILVGKNTGDIAVYGFNDSTFSLMRTIYPLVGQPINALEVDDFDEDGSLEIIIGGDEGLIVYNYTADEIKWSSGKLGGSLGRYNQLISRDIDGDGNKEIVIGSDLALYHFE